MANKQKAIFGASIAFLSLCTLLGCGGGGGGGGDGSSSSNDASYTGATTQASVTSSNSQGLAGGAYRSGDAGTTAGIASLSAGASPVKQRALTLTKKLQAAVQAMDVPSEATQASATLHQESETVSGACGGNFSYNISYDDVSGHFSGTLRFNNYCDEAGDAVSGRATFGGTLNPNTEEFLSFTITMTNITVIDDSDSYTVTGTIGYSFPSATSVTVSQTFNIRDANGTVSRLENFVLTLVGGGGYVDMAITSGRFYYPADGYIDVSSVSPFRIFSGSDHPSSGSITVTGANGSRARLSALNSLTFQLDTDADGNGIYETTTTGNWSSL